MSSCIKSTCVEDVIDVRRILAEYVTLSRWGNSRLTGKKRLDPQVIEGVITVKSPSVHDKEGNARVAKRSPEV
jgi:hypothetical protein